MLVICDLSFMGIKHMMLKGYPLPYANSANTKMKSVLWQEVEKVNEYRILLRALRGQGGLRNGPDTEFLLLGGKLSLVSP